MRWTEWARLRAMEHAELAHTQANANLDPSATMHALTPLALVQVAQHATAGDEAPEES